MNVQTIPIQVNPVIQDLYEQLDKVFSAEQVNAHVLIAAMPRIISEIIVNYPKLSQVGIVGSLQQLFTLLSNKYLSEDDKVLFQAFLVNGLPLLVAELCDVLISIRKEAAVVEKKCLGFCRKKKT